MSTTYKAGQVPDDPKDLVWFLREELSRLQQVLNGAQPFAELQVLTAEPKKYRPGVVVLADGTNWNPGSGPGMYRRNSANTAWVFVG